MAEVAALRSGRMAVRAGVVAVPILELNHQNQQSDRSCGGAQGAEWRQSAVD